jgi:hypothetical protein
MAFVAVGAFAQSPVEDLMEKYSKTPQADYFEASGLKLYLARPALMTSPLAPVASEVQSLVILQMGRASAQDQERFESNLAEALRSYQNFGSPPSPNGPVKVYVIFANKNTVSELVIYNQARSTLNDIHGNFPVSALQKLK